MLGSGPLHVDILLTIIGRRQLSLLVAVALPAGFRVAPSMMAATGCSHTVASGAWQQLLTRCLPCLRPVPCDGLLAMVCGDGDVHNSPAFVGCCGCPYEGQIVNGPW